MRTSLALAVAVLAIARLAAGDAALPAPERKLIEAMIASVQALGDARFVRNGREYPASDAAKFLRKKWGSLEDEVHSAQDFVEKVGSFSSTTGKPYVIRYPDHREQPTAEFLRARLSQLRGK
jgi:hypothetical protein